MNRVVCWTIELEWADGTKETLADLPDHVATEVGEFLTIYEKVMNNENN